MTTTSSNTCPQCGALIPEDSAHGLCPRCVFAKALAPTADGGFVPHVPPSLESVRAAFPHLEVIGLIGSGGMGAVFKARQPQLDRFVALKILPAELAGQPGFSERFQREAQALARLSHPHIVTVHDFGQAEGFYYLLMEFIDGVNLRQLLQTKRLTPKEALSIVPPICEALQCAHDHGIVHRDVKPENLLIDKAGVVKIADFGIAKIVERTSEFVSADPTNPTFESRTTMPFGTPDYAAPEQTSGSADHRADIYSLGVVLYEMLTGERPTAKLEAPSKRVQVDIRIDEIVLRALEKSPELRFATAAEFRTCVESLGQPLPQVSAPPQGGGSLWLLAAGIFVALFVSLMIVLAAIGYKSPLGTNELLALVGLSLGIAWRILRQQNKEVSPSHRPINRSPAIPAKHATPSSWLFGQRWLAAGAVVLLLFLLLRLLLSSFLPQLQREVQVKWLKGQLAALGDDADNELGSQKKGGGGKATTQSMADPGRTASKGSHVALKYMDATLVLDRIKAEHPELAGGVRHVETEGNSMVLDAASPSFEPLQKYLAVIDQPPERILLEGTMKESLPNAAAGSGKVISRPMAYTRLGNLASFRTVAKDGLQIEFSVKADRQRKVKTGAATVPQPNATARDETFFLEGTVSESVRDAPDGAKKVFPLPTLQAPPGGSVTFTHRLQDGRDVELSIKLTHVQPSPDIRQNMGKGAAVAIPEPDSKSTLQMRWVQDAPSEETSDLWLVGNVRRGGTMEELHVQKQSLLDESALASVKVVNDAKAGTWGIEFQFNESGGRRFAELTREAKGRKLAIVIDRKLYAAPVITGEITGGLAVVQGNWPEQVTRALAANVAVVLKAAQGDKKDSSQAAPPKQVPAASAADNIFGLTKEHALFCAADGIAPHFQFAGGKTFAIRLASEASPAEIKADLEKAEAAGGVDFSLSQEAGDILIHPHGCAFGEWMTGHHSLFMSMSANSAMASVGELTAKKDAIRLARGQWPVSCVFRTSRGAVGWLGIRSADQPKGKPMRVFFEYKLVKKLAGPPQTVSEFVQKGTALWNQGDFEGVVRVYDEAIKHHPRETGFFNNRANAHAALQQYDKALADYGEAMRLDPGNNNFHRTRSMAYFQMGDYDHAIADLDIAVKSSPEGVHFDLRGRAYHAKGDFKAALDDYEQGVQKTPGFTPTFLDLAWLLATCPDGSIRDGQKASQYADLAVGAKLPDASVAQAAAHAEQHDYAAAIRLEQEVLKTLPPNSDEAGRSSARLRLYQAHQPVRSPQPIIRAMWR